jgi:hypothetical protein
MFKLKMVFGIPTYISDGIMEVNFNFRVKYLKDFINNIRYKNEGMK